MAGPSVPNVNYRVTGTAGGLMIGVALLFDAIQVLLTLTVFGAFVNWFIAILSFCTFALWFFILKVDFLGGRQMVTKTWSALSGIVIELIPFLDALPATTLSVALIIFASRKEDRQKALDEAERQQRLQLIADNEAAARQRMLAERAAQEQAAAQEDS